MILTWVLALRPKTLIAAFVPVLVATTLAMRMELFSAAWISWAALGSALCIQIATNLLNDAIDFKKGADTEERLGPKRVTQSGLLRGSQVFKAGVFFLVLALVLGVPLVLRGGVPIVALGLVSLFLAYGYTGGPFPLAYLGLGDLFVILFFGLFAVGGTFYLQSLSLAPEAIVAGLQIGFLSTVLIAINNLRDRPTDEKVHKRTLAVLLGDSFVRFEIASLFALSYLLLLFYVTYSQWLYPLIVFALLPLAVFIVGGIYLVTERRKLNQFLALSALHQLLFAVLLALGFLL